MSMPKCRTPEKDHRDYSGVYSLLIASLKFELQRQLNFNRTHSFRRTERALKYTKQRCSEQGLLQSLWSTCRGGAVQWTLGGSRWGRSCRGGEYQVGGRATQFCLHLRVSCTVIRQHLQRSPPNQVGCGSLEMLIRLFHSASNSNECVPRKFRCSQIKVRTTKAIQSSHRVTQAKLQNVN